MKLKGIGGVTLCEGCRKPAVGAAGSVSMTLVVTPPESSPESS